MYVGPQKFVESDFVARMRLKYSTTSEDGTVTLTPKGNILFGTIGAVAGTAVVIAMTVVASRTILKQNDTETSIES